MNSVYSLAAIPRAVWRPPRPVWVSLLNRVGVTLGSPAALVPLHEPSLLEVAKAATGILLFDIANEANLTLVGSCRWPTPISASSR